MRFKASLEREQFSIVYNQVKLLSEQGKNAVFALAADFVRATISMEDDAMLVYTTLNTPAVFNEFKVESKTENVICLDIQLANLLHALKSGLGAHSTTLKLAKKQLVAYLCVTTQTVEGGVEVVQNVPVRVLGVLEQQRYRTEQSPGVIKVRLVFPSPRPVYAVVDRMRAIIAANVAGAAAATAHGAGASSGASSLRLEADKSTRAVTVSVRSDTVGVRTYFRDLLEEEEEEEGAAAAGGGEGAAGAGSSGRTSPLTVAHVNIRHMAKALKAVAHLGCSMLLCVASRSVVVHTQNADRTTSLSFILAVVDVGASYA